MLNLVGQMVITGLDPEAYDNSSDAATEEAQLLQDWRSNGPLGVLMDIVSHIRTPLQNDLLSRRSALSTARHTLNDTGNYS
jgi:hypothetical protein